MGLRHRNFSAVHFNEVIGTDQAGIAFNEVEAKRQGQDRDHDHEPVAMLTENLNHGRAGNLRADEREPSGFWRDGFRVVPNITPHHVSVFSSP